MQSLTSFKYKKALPVSIEKLVYNVIYRWQMYLIDGNS